MSGAKPQVAATLHTRVQAECVDVLDQVLELQANEEEVLSSFVRCLTATLSNSRSSRTPQRQTTSQGRSSSRNSDRSPSVKRSEHDIYSNTAETWILGVRDAEHLVIHLKIQETKHDSLVTHFQRLADAFARSLLLANTSSAPHGGHNPKQARGSHCFEALAEKVRQLSGELSDFTKLQWEAVESLGDQLKAAIAGSNPSPGNVALSVESEGSVSGVVRFAQQLLDVVATKRKLIITLTSVLGQIQVPPPQKLQQQSRTQAAPQQRTANTRETLLSSARSATVSPDSVADSVADAVTSAEKAATRLVNEEHSNHHTSIAVANDQETRRRAMQWLRNQHEYGSISPATPSVTPPETPPEAPPAVQQSNNSDRAFRRETFGYGGLRGNGNAVKQSLYQSPTSNGSGGNVKECEFLEVEDESVYLSPSPQAPPQHGGKYNKNKGNSTTSSRSSTYNAHAAVSLADLETPPSIQRKSKTGSVAENCETPPSDSRGFSYDDDGEEAAPFALSPTSEALSEPSPQDGHSPQYYRGSAAPPTTAAATGSSVTESTRSRGSVSTRDRTSLSLSLSPPPPLARNLMCSEFNNMSTGADNSSEAPLRAHSGGNPHAYTRDTSSPPEQYRVAIRQRSPPHETTTSPPSPTISSTRGKSGENGKSDYSPSLSPMSPSVSPDAHWDKPAARAVTHPQHANSVSSDRPKQAEAGNVHAAEGINSQKKMDQLNNHDQETKHRDHAQWNQPSSARSAHSITSTAGETQNSPSSTMHNTSAMNSLHKPIHRRADIVDSNADSPKDRVAVQWRAQRGEGEEPQRVSTSPQRISNDEQRFTNEQFHARLLSAEHAIEHHHALVELLRADIRRLEAERGSLIVEQQEWKTLESELTTTVRKKDKQIEELRRTLSSSEARRNELVVEVRQLKKRLLTTAATAAAAASSASLSPPSRASSSSPGRGGGVGATALQAETHSPVPSPVNCNQHPYSTGWSAPQPEREQAYTWRSHLQEQRNRLLRQVEQRRLDVQQQQQQPHQSRPSPPPPPPPPPPPLRAPQPRKTPIDITNTGATISGVSSEPNATTPHDSSPLPNVERVLLNARALLRSINPTLVRTDSRSSSLTSVHNASERKGNRSNKDDAHGGHSSRLGGSRRIPTTNADPQFSSGKGKNGTFIVDDDDDERGSGRRAMLERKLRGLGRTDPTEEAVSPCASLSYSASKQVGSEYNTKQRHDSNPRARNAYQEDSYFDDYDDSEDLIGGAGTIPFERTQPPSRSTSSARDDLMDDLRDQLDDLYREQASVTAQEAQINAKRESAVQQLQKQLQTMIAAGKGNETAELVAQANTVMAKFSSVRRTVEANRAAIDEKIRLVKRQIETLESDLL